VYVYTFALDLYKYTGNYAPVPGAQFSLEFRDVSVSRYEG